MVKRIIIALVILPLLVLIIFSPSQYLFMGLAVVALTMALNELYVMLDKKGDKNYRLTGLVFSLIVYTMIIFEFKLSFYFFAAALFFMGLFFMIILSKDVKSFPRVFNTIGPVSYITILGSFALLIRQFDNGTYWIFLLLLMTMVYDGGAYFVGSALGKHKLIPELSPGKTVEGCIGGIVINMIVITVIFFTMLPKGLMGGKAMLPHLLILSVLMSVIGQTGDIAESVIKRYAGVKNSSELLPEHGGVLDKIDSIMFNAPVLYFYVKYIIMS
jgi:phosphatidate cytidylyltransferase